MPKLETVIIAEENKGQGTSDYNVVRSVTRVYATDGTLIAENDSFFDERLRDFLSSDKVDLEEFRKLKVIRQGWERK